MKTKSLFSSRYAAGYTYLQLFKLIALCLLYVLLILHDMGVKAAGNDLLSNHP